MDTYRGIAVGAQPDPMDQDILPGVERMAQNVFFRTLNCWKIGDVSATKFKELPPKPQLPMNSILHVMDNFQRIEEGLPISDLPNLDYPFILNENFRKYIHHVLAPQTDGIIKSPNDYVYRTLQLQRNLEKFRSQYSGKYLFARSLDPIKERGPFLGIVNHNPIFRLFCRGVMPYWRAIGHCLTSIFNVALQMPEKLHYFMIPLSPKIYTKSKFQQSSVRITNGSLVFKTSYQYMFFVQLYNFVNTLCTLPTVFDQIPKEFYPKINLVFYMGDNYLIWTLYDLINLNERNQIYTRLFNHFNGFVLTSMAKDMAKRVDVIDDRDDIPINDQTNAGALKDSKIELDIATSFSNLTNTPLDADVYDVAPEEPSPEELTKTDTRDLERLLVSIQGVHFTMADKDMTSLDLSDVNDIIETEMTEPEVSTDTPMATTPGGTTPQGAPASVEHVAEFTGTFYKEDQLETVRLPNESHEPFKEAVQMEKMGKQFIDYIDNKSIVNIKRDRTLTMAQKDRAAKMAESYKSVTLNGKTLKELIESKTDPSVDSAGDIDILKKSLPDESMIHSSISDLDRVYMEKMFYRHMATVAASMVEHGLYLQEIEEKVTNTELTQTKEFVFKYKTVHGKQHTIVYSMPIVRDDGTFLVNGIRSMMTKQLYNKPIAKISPTRVSLASNYNKTIVEKRSASAHDFGIYFDQLVALINDTIPGALKIVYGVRNLPDDSKCGYEYARLTRKYHSIELKHQKQNATSFLYFGEPDARKEEAAFKDITPAQWKDIETFESEQKVVFLGRKTGNASYTPARYYIDRGSRLLMIGTSGGVSFNVPISLLDLIQGATEVYMKKQLTEWVDIKILDGKFPVGFLLCYRFGLLTMLRRLSVKYKIVNTRSMKNENLKATDVVIRFADNKALVIPRYPLKTSLIFQGLTMFDTKMAPIEEYEDKDVYYRLLMAKKQGNGRTNYLIGIDDTFDMFIDAMTFDRLVQMREPTTFEGLLIRATEMLTVPYHKEASAMANHCLRTYERMNAILYNEMTSQYRSYRKQRGKLPFSINPNAVLQRIIQDQTVLQVEDINPIHDIKTSSKVTYLGMGGRTAESFTIQDRRYPKDGIGMLSEATPDSGNVAITAQASMDPIIGNVYGLIEPDVNPKDLEPTQILSVSSLLMPCVTQDDQLN